MIRRRDIDRMTVMVAGWWHGLQYHIVVMCGGDHAMALAVRTDGGIGESGAAGAAATRGR